MQLRAAFAELTTNVAQSEWYIQQAASAGAELVLLPEFFTSAIGFSEKMLDVPAQNESVPTVLAEWAARYRIIIGGSYLAFNGKDAFNVFELVFPNGQTFARKKDIPTQFENCYYTEGDANHILVTPAGNFGVALCWEMIRYDTLRRLAGKVDVILAGFCCWDLPDDAPAEREPLRRDNQELALETPVTFAKLAHKPVVHANHCGKVAAYSFPDAGKRQTRQLVGGAQIVDGNGQVLVRRAFSQGPGL